MAASYRMQSVMPVGYSRPRAITNPRTGVQSGWSSFPTRRYPFAARRGALRKAQTYAPEDDYDGYMVAMDAAVGRAPSTDIIKNGISRTMRKRTDAFLGKRL